MKTPRLSVVLASFLFALVFAPTGSSQTYSGTGLYSFTDGNDGARPTAGLISDNLGNLYGTTLDGGKYGFGTVFKLTRFGSRWSLTTLHAFTGDSDGASPVSRLSFHDNSLYGTTYSGGACPSQSSGCGVAFQLSEGSGNGWTLSVVHTFAGGTDGISPAAGVIFDSTGAMYGTTFSGGGSSDCSADGCGVVFQLIPPSSAGGSWSENILHAFGGFGDGVWPYGELIFDKMGNLYGTTYVGGSSDDGTVFQLSPPENSGASWTETVLYSFKGGESDGNEPVGALVLDHSGNLFGSTYIGGTTCAAGGQGCGTVFKLEPPSVQQPAWTERVIHKFGTGNDGQFPYGSLHMDSAGALYGVTNYGGIPSSTVCPLFGCGTVFQLVRPATTGGAWQEDILYNFTGGTDGALPWGEGLLFDSAGNIYGTASGGGVGVGDPCGNGCGVVFELSP
jgi:uncharacterized repeat protein (TIGR03803 family)